MPNENKVSVITAVYNRKSTIQSTIDSVIAQKAENLEYITVDGVSQDGTEEIIENNSSNISISIREPDKGIYDALNKGVTAASGEIIGFLHADDLFADDQAVRRIQSKFSEGCYDAIYGDLLYVDFDNPEKIIRYWKSGKYNQRRFRFGWMPPHPTVYIRKSIYVKYGMYRTDLGSAADYECMVRLMFKNKIRVGYLPHCVVKMRVGGASNASIQNRLSANRNDRLAWIENELRPPFGLRFTKPLSKLPQYIFRPVENF